MSSPSKRAASEDRTKEEMWDDMLNFQDIIDDQLAKAEADFEKASSSGVVPDEASAASSTGQTSHRAKKPRRGKNSPEPNYSQMVQNQMSSTNRTGQACDRCKGRKMKCDSNPTGCANCCASNVPCTQTDPITRESHTRGEIIRLRAEVAQLRAENQRLRESIRESSYGEGRPQGPATGMAGAMNFPHQGQQQLPHAGMPGYQYGVNPYAAGMGRRPSLLPDVATAPLPNQGMGRGASYQGYNQGYTQPYGQQQFLPPSALPSAPPSVPTSSGYYIPMAAPQSSNQMAPGFTPAGLSAVNPPHQPANPGVLDFHQRNERQLQQLRAREARQQALQAQQQAQIGHGDVPGYSPQGGNYHGESANQPQDDQETYDGEDAFQYGKEP